MSKLKKLVILSTMAFLLFTFAAYAQDGAEELDLTELSLEDLMSVRIYTVYAASRYEQSVTEAPSSVSIIAAEDIKRYGYRDLGEILASVRGFHVTDDRNYKYLGVRGFGLPSDYSNRVLILVDGVRTNENIYDSPFVDGFFAVDIDLIDRIEIVRGPGSSLYGSNAFFAVVNVITRRGGDLDGFEVSGEAGTFNRNKTRISYGNDFSNGLELLLSASYLDSDGNETLDYSDTYNENPWICPGDDPDECYTLQDAWWYIDEPVAEGLDYERDKNLFAELRFKDYVLQGAYMKGKRGVPTAPWETIFNDNRIFTEEEQWWVDLKYEHVYDNELSLMARINYNHYKYRGDYGSDDTGGDDLEIARNDDGVNGEWVYGEAQVSKMLWEKHRLIAGANYQLSIKQEQFSVWKPLPQNWEAADFHDERDQDNWGVYVQDEYSITDMFTLNAGVRYDHFESVGGSTNPRVGLVFSPNDKTTLKAVYGTAFRAPSAYELYYNDGDVSAKANPDLMPEEIDTYEIIYEQYVGDNIRGTIVGFYYEIEDLIQQEVDPSDGILFFDNVGQVDARGVEFEVEGTWESGLSGRLSYTYTKTESDDTGKSLSNSPRHLAKANLTIPIVKNKLLLGIEEQFVSKRRTLYREKQDDLPASLRNSDYPSDRYAGSYAITNITLFAKNIFRNVEASASVYNLFDREYSHPGAGEHFQDVIEQDGRTVRFKVTYKF